MLFNFIYKKECNIKLIFKILKHSKIAERFDVSGKFGQQFKMSNENVKKQMGLYEIENTDNANICTNAINPKENIEKLKNRLINKKHKGIRRDTLGMNFESYAERIKVLRELDSERVNKKLIQKRLQVTNTEMKMTSVSKVQFANLNDKRYYFSDGVVSLPFGHPLLSDLLD